MGKRYKAIFKFLNLEYCCADIHSTPDQILKMVSRANRIVIATPTETHKKYLYDFAMTGIPVLCEKPFSKNLEEVEKILNVYARANNPLEMVAQYKMLDGHTGDSYYNFYNHGKDGLVWDCIQIIGLARGEVEVSETSPVWYCKLNGKEIDLRDMDGAYVKFFSNWNNFPWGSFQEIYQMHKKTVEYQNQWILNQ